MATVEEISCSRIQDYIKIKKEANTQRRQVNSNLVLVKISPVDILLP